MEEYQWLSSRDPRNMLAWLPEILRDTKVHMGDGNAQLRRERLVMVGICRRALADGDLRLNTLVNMVELRAEGKLDDADLQEAYGRGPGGFVSHSQRFDNLYCLCYAAAASLPAFLQEMESLGGPWDGESPDYDWHEEHMEAWADIVRDVIGNPFHRPRPVYNPPEQYLSPGGIACLPHEWPWLRAWETDEVRNMAQAAYEGIDARGVVPDGYFAAISDALEESLGSHGVGSETRRLVGVLIAIQPAAGEGWKVVLHGPGLSPMCPVTPYVNRRRTAATDWANANLQVSWRGKGSKGGMHGDGLYEVTVPHPLLAHLRSPGPHVRGCWALDLLTGRA